MPIISSGHLGVCIGNFLDKANLIMNTCKIYPDNEGKLGGLSKCQCCVNATDLEDFNHIHCKPIAQLVKASVGQADVQRFESHLRHNWLSCSVFLVKSIINTLGPLWHKP